MRVLKTDIPVGDNWTDHQIGNIVHVGHQKFGHVTIWWIDEGWVNARRLRVFATGAEVPNFAIRNSPVHRGTAIDVGAGLVWHLFEDVL